MMPKVLWETTLSPKTRRLLRVEIADALQTDKIINELMGKDPSERASSSSWSTPRTPPTSTCEPSARSADSASSGSWLS